MSDATSAVDRLIEMAQAGHPTAKQELLEIYRARLRRMIELRLDDRLAARVDASDVLQVTLWEAAQRLSDYVRRTPLPFYVWLRQIAVDTLVDLHRRHVLALKRSVLREDRIRSMMLSSASAAALMSPLIAAGPTPSQHLEQVELRARVQGALADLPGRSREILIMRYVEELSSSEIAAALGLSVRTVQASHVQALVQLKKRLTLEE